MKNKKNLYIALIVLFLLGVFAFLLIPKADYQSPTLLDSDYKSNQSNDEEIIENLPINDLAQVTADKIIQMSPLNNNWQIYQGNEDMGEFSKISDGVYNFDKSTNCSTTEWKDHEGCKYFSTSLFIPFVNTDQTASIAITLHEAINQDLYDELLNSYIDTVSRNKERGVRCSGGVLQNKQRTLFVNVIPYGGETTEEINVIFEKIKTEFDLEVVHNCAS